MGTEPLIRPLLPEEAEAVATLARVVWQEAYPAIIPQAQIDYMLAQRYAPALIRAQLEAGMGWAVVEQAGELLGFASWLTPPPPGETKLDKLYVHPAHQRRGLGGRLLAHVAEAARRAGSPTLILAVNKRNLRAQGAYRKYGFAVRESVVVDIGGGFVMDDFIMAKSLI